MKIVDLTVMLSSDMPVFSDAPPLRIEERFSVAERGFRVSDIAIDTHSGTHIDAPSHMLEDGIFLENFPIDTFVGPAFMMDVKQFAGGKVPLSEFRKYEKEIEAAEFVILNSGWHKKYATPDYDIDFPNPTEEAAQWLAEFPNLKGLGVDMPSLDHHGLEPLADHKALMAKDKLIIENLSNLDGLPSKFLLVALPLKCRDMEGAPCRAIAMVDPS
jgi:arylformamidase